MEKKPWAATSSPAAASALVQRFAWRANRCRAWSAGRESGPTAAVDGLAGREHPVVSGVERRVRRYGCRGCLLYDVDRRLDVVRRLDQPAHSQLRHVQGSAPIVVGSNVTVGVVAEDVAARHRDDVGVGLTTDGDVGARLDLVGLGRPIGHPTERDGLVAADDDDIAEVLRGRDGAVDDSC